MADNSDLHSGAYWQARAERAEAALAELRARVEAAPVGRVRYAGWTLAEVRIDDESIGAQVESLLGTRVRLVAEGEARIRSSDRR